MTYYDIDINSSTASTPTTNITTINREKNDNNNYFESIRTCITQITNVYQKCKRKGISLQNPFLSVGNSSIS